MRNRRTWGIRTYCVIFPACVTHAGVSVGAGIKWQFLWIWYRRPARLFGTHRHRQPWCLCPTTPVLSFAMLACATRQMTQNEGGWKWKTTELNIATAVNKIKVCVWFKVCTNLEVIMRDYLIFLFLSQPYRWLGYSPWFFLYLSQPWHRRSSIADLTETSGI